MKFRYEIYPEARTIVLRVDGKLTLAGLIAAINELWMDPRYSLEFDGLVDLTSASVSIEMSDFRPVIEYVRQSPHTSSGRWAAVADSPMATACGFIYRKAISSRHSFEVFSTREAAGRFLGVAFGSGELFAEGNTPRRV